MELMADTRNHTVTSHFEGFGGGFPPGFLRFEAVAHSEHHDSNLPFVIERLDCITG